MDYNRLVRFVINTIVSLRYSLFQEMNHNASYIIALKERYSVGVFFIGKILVSFVEALVLAAKRKFSLKKLESIPLHWYNQCSF